MVALGLLQLPDVLDLEGTIYCSCSCVIRHLEMLTPTHMVTSSKSISFRKLRIGVCSPFSKFRLIILRVWVYKNVSCVETSTAPTCL